jgi:Asp-tRNA(Asn)/Glu-tRNA(Gln) amidotransferase A subunit family amidase
MEKVSGVDYANALDACHYLNGKLVETFNEGDFILTPTTCGQTPKVGSAYGTINGEETEGWVAFTYGINMTRNPAGTVCVGRTKLGLPIGLHIIGNQRDDVGVLKTMCFLEDLLAQPHNAPFGAA